MFEVGRELWRFSRPTPSRISLSRLSNSMSKWDLTAPRDEASTASLSNPCHSSTKVTVQKCFPVFRWYYQCFIWCPLSHWVPEKRLGLPCLYLIWIRPLSWISRTCHSRRQGWKECSKEGSEQCLSSPYGLCHQGPPFI